MASALVVRRIVLGLTLALAPTMSQSRASACGGSVSACANLSDEATTAIRFLLDEHFPPPDTLACGLTADEMQIRVLRRHRESVIPCLSEVGDRGLGRTGIWTRRDGPPDVRRWIIGEIGLIDPVLAIRMYRTKLDRSNDRWEQLDLRLMMLQFGDRSSLKAIVALLGQVKPESLRRNGRETAAADPVLNAIYVLVRYDDREIVPVLKRVHDVLAPDRKYLGVWVAQLERDVPALERFARNGQMSFALDSLARIEARDVLQRLAADPGFYGREKAQMLLSEGPPPLPPEVDAVSPCLRLDEKGKRELEYWIAERFPPPGYRPSDCGTQSLPFALMSQRDTASACVEDIYRRGLAGIGSWPQVRPAPHPGIVMLGLLGPINRELAAQLWHEWAESSGRTAWQRAMADWNRVLLGDRGGVGGMVEYLRATLDTSRDAPGGPGYLLDESAAALIQIDHRPAVSLLEKWRKRGYLKTVFFDIGMAKLARNPAELERLARESEQATAAIQALGFLKARDSLGRLADDPGFKYRYLARNELEALH